MLKSFSSNLFLVSILMMVLVLPIGSFRLVKTETSVLGKSDIKTQALQEIIEEQKITIEQLTKENNKLKEDLLRLTDFYNN